MREIVYHLFHNFKLLILNKILLTIAFRYLVVGIFKIESLMANTVKNSLSNTKSNHQNMTFGMHVAHSRKIMVFRHLKSQKQIDDWYFVGVFLHIVLGSKINLHCLRCKYCSGHFPLPCFIY